MAKSGWNPGKNISKSLVEAAFESCFFMVEIDSAPSKTSRAPDLMKFNRFYSVLQKFWQEFFKIWP